MKDEGFTIIELLVVFTFIGILTALGIAAYSTYNSKQTVQSSAMDVVTLLNTAKSRALTQVIPPSCGTNSVTGYQVDIAVNAQQYSLSAICGSPQVITRKNLPPNVTFANGSDTTVFFTISDGTAANSATIIVTGYGKTSTISVGKTGTISVN